MIDFERVAWREGRRRAQRYERHALATFLRICLRTLRPLDIAAHEAGTDVFLAALLPDAALEPEGDLSRMARAVVAELARRFGEATGFTLEWGWTVVESDDALESGLRAAIDAALSRGRSERERFGFFATLGHEMRTPLTSISGYVQTLLEREVDPQTLSMFLETTQLEALRLRRLVDSMYELSLMDLDEQLVSGVRCDLQTALERACDAIYPLAALRGTTVKVCGRSKRTIPLAGERAVTLFSNLLENAVKHGRPGGRVEIRHQEQADRLAIFVDDDGTAVPEADRERIFERGARGSHTPAPGSGLGLAIVHGIMRRIGGEVAVSRSPLGGARFAVCFPLQLASAACAAGTTP